MTKPALGALAALVAVSLATASPVAEAQQQQDIVADEPADIRLDFRDVQIATLVELLGRLSNLIVIVPDDLSGEVSVFSPEALTLTQAFRVIAAVLDSRGLTMARDDQFLRVIGKQESVQKPVEIHYGSVVERVPLEDRVITQVIPVENADAANMEANLRPLVSNTGNLFVSRDNNLLVLTDIATNVRRLLQLVNHLDVRRPITPSDETRVYNLRYMKAVEVSEALEQVFAGRGAEQRSTIVPVETANALIITAGLGEHTQIERTISSLDIRRRQVLIEVKIVEGTLRDEKSSGINLLEYLFRTTRGLHSVAFGQSVEDPYISYTLRSNEVDLVLTAAASDDLIKILSAPRVLTSDNHEARIVVAQEEPIVRSVTDLSTSTNVPRTVSDFVYRDVGIDLTVTPRINRDRDVDLDIAFSITSLLANVPLPGQTFAPRIGKREGNTSVTVMDGSTLVIGGLIKDDYRDQRQRVPILGHIPLLGKAFSTTKQVKDQTELLIFITPRVATSMAEGEQITDDEEAAMSERFKKISQEYTDERQRIAQEPDGKPSQDQEREQ